MPFIIFCLGVLSIVVAAFILNLIVGFVVLGIGLMLLAFMASPDSLKRR